MKMKRVYPKKAHTRVGLFFAEGHSRTFLTKVLAAHQRHRRSPLTSVATPMQGNRDASTEPYVLLTGRPSDAIAT